MLEMLRVRVRCVALQQDFEMYKRRGVRVRELACQYVAARTLFFRQVGVAT